MKNIFNCNFLIGISVLLASIIAILSPFVFIILISFNTINEIGYMNDWIRYWAGLGLIILFFISIELIYYIILKIIISFVNYYEKLICE